MISLSYPLKLRSLGMVKSGVQGAAKSDVQGAAKAGVQGAAKAGVQGAAKSGVQGAALLCIWQNNIHSTRTLPT